MKNNKIVSDVKKAGVVATAVLTLNACGHKQSSESQTQTAYHKADSALTVHPEYRIASALIDLCETRINEYRNANKNLVKSYSRDYIKQNLTDAALAKFMLNAINNDSVLFELDDDDYENDTISVDTLNTMPYIRRTQRWFNDMMLYLKDKYTEQQLLNSDFFKVINSPELQRQFKYNTSKMEQLRSSMEFPLERKKTIKTEVFNKYVKETKRQR
jgi:hypothetical protein